MTTEDLNAGQPSRQPPEPAETGMWTSGEPTGPRDTWAREAHWWAWAICEAIRQRLRRLSQMRAAYRHRRWGR